MNANKFFTSVKDTWSDLQNAVLNPSAKSMVKRITTIDLTVRKMATTHIGLMISLAVSCLDNDECYLNIGTWNGYSFFSGFLMNSDKECIGNDNFTLFNKENSVSTFEKDKANRNFGDIRNLFYSEFERIKSANSIFYEGEWKSLLSNFKSITNKKIGFYFYDAGHDFCSQYEALDMVLPYLSQTALILIDDTNIPDVRLANDKFLEKHKDFSRIIDIETPCNRYPTWWDGIQIMVRNYS